MSKLGFDPEQNSNTVSNSGGCPLYHADLSRGMRACDVNTPIRGHTVRSRNSHKRSNRLHPNKKSYTLGAALV